MNKEGNAERELVVLENMPVDRSVYYKPCYKLGSSAIEISWKIFVCPIRSQESAVKKKFVKQRSAGEGPSSVSPNVNNDNVFIEIVLGDTEGPVADTDTAILRSVLKNYCHIFYRPFQELPHHLVQCNWDVETKIEFVRTDPRTMFLGSSDFRHPTTTS